MKRIIVDYSKLNNEILSLLVEKFPDGYDDSDIISFRNAKNELIEAVEVRTSDTIYLVKVSKKLATRIENFEDEDDNIQELDIIVPDKKLGIDKELDEEFNDDDVEEDDDDLDKDDFDDDDEDDADQSFEDEEED